MLHGLELVADLHYVLVLCWNDNTMVQTRSPRKVFLGDMKTECQMTSLVQKYLRNCA